MSNIMPDSTITESKYATLAAIHDFRELGDSWPKAIRSSIPFKYLQVDRIEAANDMREIQ